LTDADLTDGRFWLLLPPYALVMAAPAVAHGLAVQWLLAPLPTLADYASRGVVVTWILLGAWYAEAVIGTVVRWEAGR
jgi:hypothetical protein